MGKIGENGKTGRGAESGKTNVKIPRTENRANGKMVKPIIATQWGEVVGTQKGGRQGPRCHAYRFCDPTGYAILPILPF